MPTLNETLKRFKTLKGSAAYENLELFKSILLKTSPQDRGKGLNFSRVPGDGKDGELWFRNKLVWLKTIPLQAGEAFISLHAEAGGYYSEKAGDITRDSEFSADILGILRKEKTTQFAVAELKARAKGDPIFYAVAEGLRNVYLLWHERNKISLAWKRYSNEFVVQEKVRRSVWREGSPFNKLDNKNVSLLIIGDDSWIQNQRICLKDIPVNIQMGTVNVIVSVYSLREGGKSKSKPYALLPLVKHL